MYALVQWERTDGTNKPKDSNITWETKTGWGAQEEKKKNLASISQTHKGNFTQES